MVATSLSKYDIPKTIDLLETCPSYFKDNFQYSTQKIANNLKSNLKKHWLA